MYFRDIPRRYFLVVATFCLSLLLYVDRACISTAKEPMVAELGLSDRQWGAIMSAFAFGYALLQTPSGMLADKHGSRRLLTGVVAFWSLFTGLTALAWNFWSLLIVRFLFGAGEAGAFPGLAKVVYSWIPLHERGVVKGINFSGSRIGAAITMPLLPMMFDWIGWKMSFFVLMVIGFVWATFWWQWFKDEPERHAGVGRDELKLIKLGRISREVTVNEEESLEELFRSSGLWLMMGQYFASNFTFFFCLTWLYPYVRETYDLDSVSTGVYVMIPLLAGAVGNVYSGWLVDRMYRNEWNRFSRKLPAIIGFLLATIGLATSVSQESALGAIFWLSVAILGADMTLAPSWTYCIDIGKSSAGAVSGTMNMAGNLGAALVGLAFPLLMERFGPSGFFYTGATLNLIGAAIWCFVRPVHSKASDPSEVWL